MDCAEGAVEGKGRAHSEGACRDAARAEKALGKVRLQGVDGQSTEVKTVSWIREDGIRRSRTIGPVGRGATTMNRRCRTGTSSDLSTDADVGGIIRRCTTWRN